MERNNQSRVGEGGTGNVPLISPDGEIRIQTTVSIRESNRALQGGKVYEIRQFKDKNQNNMAFVWLDTLFGKLKVIVFASLWKQQDIRDVLEIGNIVLLHGKVSGNDILLNDVELLEKGEPVSFAM